MKVNFCFFFKARRLDLQVLAQGMLGGMQSYMAGGKFANGAITWAFSSG
jgi:hypothetical protein